jgi:hypothetical protein
MVAEQGFNERFIAAVALVKKNGFACQRFQSAQHFSVRIRKIIDDHWLKTAVYQLYHCV